MLRQGGGPLRPLRHDGQPDRDPLPDQARRRDPGARAGPRIVHEAGAVRGVVGRQTRMIAGERGLPGPDSWSRGPRPGRRAPRPPAPDLHREHHRGAGRPGLPAGSDRRASPRSPTSADAPAHGRCPALERRRRRAATRPDRARRRLRLGLLLEGPGRPVGRPWSERGADRDVRRNRSCWAAACARPASSPPARCTRSPRRRPLRDDHANAARLAEVWPAPVACRWTRERRDQHRVRRRPAGENAAALVAEMAAAGVLCADLSPDACVS